MNEQVAVEVEHTRTGFSPRTAQLWIPGQAGMVEVSYALRCQSFRTESDAADAVVAEMEESHPGLFTHWANRQGFL